MKIISYNSRILKPQKQKLATLDQVLIGIVHALKIYEFLITGSPHPMQISLITNHFYIVLQRKVTLVLVSIEIKCNN